MSYIDSESTDNEEIDFCEFVPLAICVSIFFAVILWIIIDWKGALEAMEAIIDYIRDHPYESIGIIISAYVFLVIFCLPITQAHIMVAFAYCKAYNSFWLGFLMSTWIIFIGCMIGAFCAIILSRYIIADFIKRKLHKSKSVFGKKFKAVDQIFVTNGVFIVALI